MARERVIRGNYRVIPAVIATPDQFSLSIASSMAIATNTFSPMAAGRHTSGTPRGFSGDRGYGVNRQSGRTNPVQAFHGAARPVNHPEGYRLGMQAGAAGVGLPNTGDDGGAGMFLGWSQLGRMGMGG